LDDVLAWIKQHKRRPKLYKTFSTVQEVAEQRAARQFYGLRKAYERGSLPDESIHRLDEVGLQSSIAGDTIFSHCAPYLKRHCICPDKVLPGWREDLFKSERASRGLAKANELVAWCREHNTNTMVEKVFNAAICDDEANHQRMLLMRDALREYSRKDPELYKQSLALVTDAFGPTWRGSRGGFPRVW
jgi:hypothetical protein